MNKITMREEVKEKRLALYSELYHQYSHQIQELFFSIEAFKEARTIALTVSIQNEVDTYELIKKCWELGKVVVLPRSDFKTKRLTFFQVQTFEQLEETKWGLKEPKNEDKWKVSKEQIDLVVVPGLAFNRLGARLGYGGGFYDRFLENENFVKVALAFSFQVLTSIPTEEHDQMVDIVITEKEVIYT
ncbi:5-formyltetrahydrofolate cyclo-ligase [Alkalihalobacillus pseudalcaliphilus]|uniref:5-formyltetrahydrofolate cyclo-ligase n=1 Tax=Alkalihalobacillus pseudalcaliphilus TaxID=79884 RepID=UPI00069F029A|nr:5-formyltetrahydrofolate cyclo-ligase [Alkalihalobacillus pseudalcaliphilus]